MQPPTFYRTGYIVIGGSDMRSDVVMVFPVYTEAVYGADLSKPVWAVRRSTYLAIRVHTFLSFLLSFIVFFSFLFLTLTTQYMNFSTQAVRDNVSIQCGLPFMSMGLTDC